MAKVLIASVYWCLPIITLTGLRRHNFLHFFLNGQYFIT